MDKIPCSANVMLGDSQRIRRNIDRINLVRESAAQAMAMQPLPVHISEYIRLLLANKAGEAVVLIQLANRRKHAAPARAHRHKIRGRRTGLYCGQVRRDAAVVRGYNKRRLTAVAGARFLEYRRRGRGAARWCAVRGLCFGHADGSAPSAYAGKRTGMMPFLLAQPGAA